jgi:hypothetical protein
MSIIRREVAAVFAALVVGGAESNAQQGAPTRAIPVRTLTPAVSTDSGVLRSTTNVRALSNGTVLVNDRLLRRLIMLDSTLKKLNIIADTAPGAPNRYGAQTTGLIPFMGDSSIFVDNESQSLILVDPNGKFGRVMAPPKASDLSFMASGFGNGFDEKGRAIYRVPRRAPGAASVRPPSDGSGKQIITSQPDSMAIVRADFDTRVVDTIMMIKTPVSKQVSVSMQPGSMMMTSAFNPLPQTDDWTMLPDGTIAVVRSVDYHMDWLGKDGKVTSTPKMPFDWKRITQEEKEQLLDSLKQAAAKRDAEAAAAGPVAVHSTTGRGGDGGSGDVHVSSRATGAGGAGGPPPAPGAAGMPAGMPRFPFVTVDAADLPDYYPPIRAGMMRADPDGNVWLMPSTSTLSQGSILASAGTAQTSSLVYDVIGRDGVIKERVKLPPGRLIGAFGPNGLVFLTYSPVPGVAYLERARITRAGATAQ